MSTPLYKFWDLEIITNALGATDGCLLFEVSIAILLFVDAIIIMSHLVKFFQWQPNILASFFHTHKLQVSLEKTNVMAFNIPKMEASVVVLTYNNERIEVVSVKVWS